MSWKDEEGKRQVSERNHLAYKTAPYQSTCILAVQTDKPAKPVHNAVQKLPKMAKCEPAHFLARQSKKATILPCKVFLIIVQLLHIISHCKTFPKPCPVQPSQKPVVT